MRLFSDAIATIRAKINRWEELNFKELNPTTR